MTLPNTIDGCHDLLRQNLLGSDIEAAVMQIQPQKFMVSFFTTIDTNAEYLLEIRGESENDPHFKLVAGKVLFACAVNAEGSDRSLQSGVYEYLKQYGKWVGYKSLHVEVHKFNLAAIFEAKYEVKNEKLT